jgi:hypothetical protein
MSGEQRFRPILLARRGQGRYRASIEQRGPDGRWAPVWKCPHLTAGYSGHQTIETARRCAQRHTDGQR